MDNPTDETAPKALREFADKLRTKGHFVYVLTNYNSTHEQDMHRVKSLWEWGYYPYVMVYEKWNYWSEANKMVSIEDNLAKEILDKLYESMRTMEMNGYQNSDEYAKLRMVTYLLAVKLQERYYRTNVTYF